jgi:FkbM family methyltransferase
MTDKIQVNFLGQSFEMELHPRGELLSDIVRGKGFYSINDLIVMRELLRQGDCFLDIGANIGWHSTFAARWVGSGGLVRSFEPEAENFKILSSNLSQLNARPICLALGDRNENVTLVGTRQNRGDFRVNFPNFEDQPGLRAQTRMTTLDEYLIEDQEAAERVRYIKIDAQGCEPKILRGASKLIQRARPFVQVELSPDHIRLCGDSVFDILAFIDRSDYRPLWIQEQVGLKYEEILRPVSILDLIGMVQGFEGKKVGIDLLLVPTERVKELSSASRTV